jgi:hypothetical protein
MNENPLFLLLLHAIFLLASGCLPAEDSVPVSENPFAAHLLPDGEDVSQRPEFRLVFSDYLNEDLLEGDALTVVSGGISFSGQMRYEFVGRNLVWRAEEDLPVGVDVRVVVMQDRLRSVLGEIPVLEPERVFHVRAGQASEIAPDPVVATWADVDLVLERKCRSCHADPSWRLGDLSYGSLISKHASQRDLLLVKPYDPTHSYLLHKVIPDYPVRRFSVQPPPWSGGTPVTESELKLMEGWIRSGALR